MSEIKETFLDLLHLAGMAMSNGRHMPSTMFLDRESYNRWCNIQEMKKIRRFKYEMKKREVLRIEEKQNMILLHLSEKGRQEALKQEIICNSNELPNGQLCLVSYDIPEHAKKGRKWFRTFLKKAGFEQVHQSTWKTNKNVVQIMKDLIKELDITDWISVYQVVG